MELKSAFALNEKVKCEVDGAQYTAVISIVQVRDDLAGHHVVTYGAVGEFIYPPDLAKKMGQESDKRNILVSEEELLRLNPKKETKT